MRHLDAKSKQETRFRKLKRKMQTGRIKSSKRKKKLKLQFKSIKHQVPTMKIYLTKEGQSYRLINCEAITWMVGKNISYWKLDLNYNQINSLFYNKKAEQYNDYFILIILANNSIDIFPTPICKWVSSFHSRLRTMKGVFLAFMHIYESVH